MAHAGGRPTKYTLEMPKLFETALASGKSITEFCAEQDICFDTVSEWRKVHKEFSAIFTRAKLKGQAYWEGWLKSNLDNPKVNAPLVKLYFANRFGWSDKKEVTQDTTTHSADELKELQEARKKAQKEF